MPDWNKLVRARLGKLGLPPVEKEAIISELAAHLEDLYQGQLVTGVSEVQAVQHVITENSNWHLLARNIERAKRTEPIMKRPNETNLDTGSARFSCVPGMDDLAASAWLVDAPVNQVSWNVTFPEYCLARVTSIHWCC